MGKSYGLGPAVDGISVACPTCERPASKKCAKVGREDGLRVWTGEAKRCHPARITAAIEARQARERGKT